MSIIGKIQMEIIFYTKNFCKEASTMNPHDIKMSKFMSLVLRHRPELIDAELQENGWVPIDTLLNGMKRKGFDISYDRLVNIVDQDGKKRYAIDENQGLIRANQGHTTSVKLEYQIKIPPEHLYHGTSEDSYKSIMSSGLHKRQRHHVHLSETMETARIVAMRRKSPVILEIDSLAMHRDGIVFYLTDNDVWLCDHVPSAYILRMIKIDSNINRNEAL